MMDLKKVNSDNSVEDNAGNDATTEESKKIHLQ